MHSSDARQTTVRQSHLAIESESHSLKSSLRLGKTILRVLIYGHPFSMGLTMSSHSTAEQLKLAAVAPGALFLDVRNDAEVKESPLTSRPYLHVSCMPDDCSELTARADELLPDKNGTYDTTSYVMTFFRSVRPSGEDALVLLQITIQHDM